MNQRVTRIMLFFSDIMLLKQKKKKALLTTKVNGLGDRAL